MQPLSKTRKRIKSKAIKIPFQKSDKEVRIELTKDLKCK